MTAKARIGSGQAESTPGRRLSYWIGQALRNAREDARVPKSYIAALLNESETTITRLEKDDGLYAEFWGRDIDRAVWAYAYAIGIDDPRELWQHALNDWYEKGALPAFSEDEIPGSRFVRPIRDEARRNRPAPSARPEKRNAS